MLAKGGRLCRLFRDLVAEHGDITSVRELIEQAGATLRFLPPYSPDFNPIEEAISKLKGMLRKASERTVSGLWELARRRPRNSHSPESVI